jgi:multiple sugar transport system substrate-binding protein
MGRPLPGYVLRQNAIEGIVGEEMAAGFIGQKPIDVALKRAEQRVNTLLGELD